MIGKTYKTLLALVLTAGMLAPANALTLSGNSLFTTGDEEIIVTFQGSEAAFTNILFEDLPNEMMIFNSKTASVGQSVSLGTIASGTELVFRLDAYSPDGTNFFGSWFSGEGSRNADGIVHAEIGSLGNNTWIMSWEDLDFRDSTYDGDFDDVVVTIQGRNPVIPEPGTLALVGIGLASLSGLRRRRRGRQAAAL